MPAVGDVETDRVDLDTASCNMLAMANCIDQAKLTFMIFKVSRLSDLNRHQDLMKLSDAVLQHVGSPSTEGRLWIDRQIATT